MLSMYDIVENMEKEQKIIEYDYDYDLNDICKKYKEEDLLLYETDNRMSGADGIFFLRKDGKNKIIYVDEKNELLFKNYLINIICHLKMILLMKTSYMVIDLLSQEICLNKKFYI